ncbi:hypothetical protein SH668x_002586 [Planctomicrobium sp. SH668]|uniref:hypothetical protein n=1 Tax=Planctomicrobium sp. SH668 TaxID=3448126 RepID=UPI003F5B2A59
MMEFLQSLSDNEVAILGCVGAAVASMILLSLSYHGSGHSQPRQTLKPVQAGSGTGGTKKSKRHAA